jgi:hypothetical protein
VETERVIITIMITYLGRFNYAEYGIDECFFIFELYNNTTPYKIRKKVKSKKILEQLTPEIKIYLNNNLDGILDTILSFINLAKPVTNKLHQLDVFNTKLKNKFLAHRPFKDITTLYNIITNFKESLINILLKQIINEDYLLIEYINENRKGY